MGIIKDVYKETEGFTSLARLQHFLSLRSWKRTHRKRKQRADRGWADDDIWAGGEYILEVMAGIVNKLNEDSEEMGFDAKMAVSAIEKYLDFLVSPCMGERIYCDGAWRDETGMKLSEGAIARHIKRRYEYEEKLKNEAIEAATEIIKHIDTLWT